MIKKTLIIFIDIYKLCISPFLGKNCRFYPTCSAYMKQAITYHGAAKGLYLGLKRIIRCNPFFPGGYDPVPKDF